MLALASGNLLDLDSTLRRVALTVGVALVGVSAVHLYRARRSASSASQEERHLNACSA